MFLPPLLQVSIDYQVPLWGIASYVLGNIAGAIWFILKLYNSTEANKARTKALEVELEKTRIYNKETINEIKASHAAALLEIKINHKAEMDLIRQLMKEQTLEIRELRDTLIALKTGLELRTLSEMKRQSRAA